MNWVIGILIYLLCGLLFRGYIGSVGGVCDRNFFKGFWQEFLAPFTEKDGIGANVAMAVFICGFYVVFLAFILKNNIY